MQLRTIWYVSTYSSPPGGVPTEAEAFAGKSHVSFYIGGSIQSPVSSSLVAETGKGLEMNDGMKACKKERPDLGVDVVMG